jgi:hypothetical protein
MSKLRNYLLLGGTIAILSLTLGLAIESRGFAKPQSVLAGNAGPFQIQLCDTSACVAGHQDTFSVPSDHRLVIEFVTGQCGASESTVFLSTTVSGTTVAHNFVPLRTVNNTEGSFSQTTRLYADPGTNVVLSGNVPFPTCASVTLSGLLTTPF